MSRQSIGVLLVAVVTLVVANGCCINRYGCGSYYKGGSEYSVNECCGNTCCEATPYNYCRRGHGRCLALLAAPFRATYNLMKCGAGCGEIYWGEWASDPPDCCDPCDGCGNWTGQGGCTARLRKLFWARRYHCNMGCAGGCDGGCDGGQCGCDAAPSCGCESCASGGGFSQHSSAPSGPRFATGSNFSGHNTPGPNYSLAPERTQRQKITVEGPRFGSISPSQTETILRERQSPRLGNSVPGFTPAHNR